MAGRLTLCFRESVVDYDFDADHIEGVLPSGEGLSGVLCDGALYGMILPFIFLLTGKVRIVFPSVISIGMAC